MAADGTLVNLYTTQFATNLEMLLQQKGSKIRGRVREGFHVGKQASPINQIGAVQFQTPTGRFAPIGRVDANFTRRWVFPQDKDLPQMVDSFDELKTAVDVKGEFAPNAAAAAGREWDDAVIRAVTATAYLGQDASALTSETFDTSTYQIASTFGSSAASGLTVAKLIELKRLARHYHNDLESDPLTLVIGSKQESDLLNQVQIVSTDFNDKPVLVNGNVTRFLGIDFVISERLTVASSVRTCVAFMKSGMYLGIWKDMVTDISQRRDLSGMPWQIYSMISYGASRLQPGKIFTIQCSDSTGADITP